MTAGSGPSAPASFAFSTTPLTESNSTASVSIPALSSTVSVISSKVSSAFGATTDSATAQATTAGPFSALGGLIKGSAVQVSATSTYNLGSSTWSGSATTTLPALGTDGKTLSNNAAGASEPPLTVGAITNSVTGIDSTTQLSAATSSTVANVSVAGVLTVDAVQALRLTLPLVGTLTVASATAAYSS